ncbi:DMT family transporter [Thalassovita taeanensis]|uniref:Uncharacterized membrane protein n=1 Tax=Thalassovita taeanensis TaxID=657014 RepID=A0A1H9EEZ3_9RHOB|nr:DMT family transporter [Thalassovita taeanensis]SEQ24152.1 Uncharacterized membrane protein [Thalassovita taeanensis]
MSTSLSSRPVAGILWMLLSGLLFVCVTALVKSLGLGIPAPEAAFLRYAMGLIFVVPMLRTIVKANLTRRQWGMFALRGALHAVGVALWFYGMARMPIAELTALNYLSPIYVTLGAAVFLGEKLALRRILAVAVALIGAVIILRPGFREVGPGHVAMLIAAPVFGMSYLMAKLMSDETSPLVVVGMLSVFVTIGLAPMAAAVWVTPSWHVLGVLFCVACVATAGHYAMTIAFAAAPLTVTQPVTFVQLVWAVTLGAVVFGESVDIWVVLGGAVILGSVSFITWREAMTKRRMRTPPAVATKV